MKDFVADISAITEHLMADPVFRQCTSSSLAKLLPYVLERAVNRGEVLNVLGEPATETYLIVEGIFELSGSQAPGKTKDRRTAKRVDSGFLGEEAAIGLGAYTVTATATQSSRVLVIPSHAIEKLAEQRPFREQLLASFAARKKDDTEKNSAGKMPVVSEVIESPRLLFGWFMVLLVPLFVYGQFSDLTSLPNMPALYLLCVISATVTMWVFRLVPDFVPALFAVLCAILISQVPANVALGGFASDSFFMAMSILGLSAVITISGLSFRALMALLRVGPAHKAWYNFCLFITGAALTPVVPTTNGRIAIVAPFFSDLLGAFDKQDAKSAAPRLSGSVMSGVSLLSAIFLSSKSVNFVIFSMLPPQEQFRFQWLYWLFAASLCGVILLTLYFLGSWLLFRNSSRPSIPKPLIIQQRRILGPVKPSEWACILGLAGLFISFLTVSLHGIHIPWIALAIIMFLLLFGFLGEKDFRNGIDWNLLVYLGALIGLMGAMHHVGLDGWLTQQISWLSAYMEVQFEVFILLLAAAIFVVRLALPINATVVVFATLLIPAAVDIGINPWVVGFIILLLAEGYIWPYQASYYSMFVSLAGQDANAGNPKLVILHLMSFAFKLVAIFASIPFWQYLGLL